MATQQNTKTVESGVDKVTREAAQAAISELRGISTADRLLGLYDLGLDGCSRGNTEQINVVLEELIESLDFQYADISEGFHRVYSYCLEQNRIGELDRVAFVLQDLRETLSRAAVESEHSHLPS